MLWLTMLINVRLSTGQFLVGVAKAQEVLGLGVDLSKYFLFLFAGCN